MDWVNPVTPPFILRVVIAGLAAIIVYLMILRVSESGRRRGGARAMNPLLDPDPELQGPDLPIRRVPRRRLGDREATVLARKLLDRFDRRVGPADMLRELERTRDFALYVEHYEDIVTMARKIQNEDSASAEAEESKPVREAPNSTRTGRPRNAGELGERVEKRRVQLGMTKTAVARAMGATPPQMSDLTLHGYAPDDVQEKAKAWLAAEGDQEEAPVAAPVHMPVHQENGAPLDSATRRIELRGPAGNFVAQEVRGGRWHLTANVYVDRDLADSIAGDLYPLLTGGAD